MIKPFVFVFACTFLTFSLVAQQTTKEKKRKFTRLVWFDEFNYNGLPDATKWSYERGYVRNRELQYYTTERKENAEVKGGFLHLVVRNDSFRTNGKVVPLTSASLITKGKKEWTYGRIEIRAKFSSALGTWPAIWTLGSNIDSTHWPACGEIDILEHVGYMPDTVHFNVHTGKYNHVVRTNKGTKIFSKAPDKDFHLYALEWFPDRLDWYYDGKKVYSFANEHSGRDAWPFDRPQFLILNFAFGGSWGGQKGIDITALPQTMLVDYVRLYQ
jgi:beta-glucanase (GH16 family)